jgi:membrane fusion protein, heavy metal efflux system
MTPTTPNAPEPTPPRRQPPRTRGSRLWLAVQLVLMLAISAGLLYVLIWEPFKSSGSEPDPRESQPTAETVKVLGRGQLWLSPDSALAKKATVVPASREDLTEPLLKVTGSVAAALHKGPGNAEDRWQFSGPEILSAYTDWRKSITDVEFAEEQLGQIKELNQTRIKFADDVVKRARRLYKIGTIALKELAEAEVNLLQAKIQGKKEIYEAEITARKARQTKAALERQLIQNGVDPNLLGKVADGTAIVVADVPEAKIGRVRAGEGCQARFFGIPDKVFTGKVGSLAPILSRERRTLRVLFELKDPDGYLRPGMFAEIGLGTDPRKVLMAPADALLHVGRTDYVLVEAGGGEWRAAEVKVGELHGQSAEILGGLSEGQRVFSRNAILMQPFLIKSLQH